MRQAELLQSFSTLQVSHDALRSCGLPIARRPVESVVSAKPGRRYYFGRSWINHQLLDPDRGHYRCFWRRSKSRQERMQTVEFVLQSDLTSNFIEPGKVLSRLSDQLLQKDRYRKPYVSRDIGAFDLGIIDYATEYAICRSLHKNRKQEIKRKATRERIRAFDESQIPVITTTTTASRQYDRESGQVPASTMKQYFAELLAPDKLSGHGNMIAEKFLKDLLDIDRPFTVTIDTAAAVRNAAPIVKTEMVPCSMIPRIWPLSEECSQNTSRVKKVGSPSPREPGQFPMTVAITHLDSQVDDVTLAGGPLYLAKLRDAKKAEELVAQQEVAYNAPEKHANAEQQSESVAVLRADESISVDSMAATEKSKQSSERLDEPSADKKIVKSENVPASAQSKTEIIGPDEATLKSAPVGQVHDMEAAVEQDEEPGGHAGPQTPREKHTCKATEFALENMVFPVSNTEGVNRSSSTRGVVAADRRSDAFETTITVDEQSDMSESMERQVQEPTEDTGSNSEPLAVLKKTLESVVSRQIELQEKLDFAVSSQADLEKELHSLRSYRDAEIESLNKDIAQLQHQVAEAKNVNSNGSEIQDLKNTVGQLQHQLAQAKTDNGVPEGTVIDGADGKKSACPPNEKAAEQSTDMLVIAPALSEVRMKIAPEFSKQMFPQTAEFASNAFGQLSRSEMRRVTALANQGWVLVSVAQNGSLVFQRPERRLTGVRLAAKVLGGVIVVSSVILTMLVGYGYTTMI
ncbi:uncharacterized protein V1513DRAFT_463709 [Lipomyces chichibuensis]|uniref:uncharacterized protein n=1 Tax=Lipomyces chichibuensis TaxID=1546026 RepID=UPI003343195B